MLYPKDSICFFAILAAYIYSVFPFVFLHRIKSNNIHNIYITMESIDKIVDNLVGTNLNAARFTNCHGCFLKLMLQCFLRRDFRVFESYCTSNRSTLLYYCYCDVKRDVLSVVSSI